MRSQYECASSQLENYPPSMHTSGHTQTLRSSVGSGCRALVRSKESMLISCCVHGKPMSCSPCLTKCAMPEKRNNGEPRAAADLIITKKIKEHPLRAVRRPISLWCSKSLCGQTPKAERIASEAPKRLSFSESGQRSALRVRSFAAVSKGNRCSLHQTPACDRSRKPQLTKQRWVSVCSLPGA